VAEDTTWRIGQVVDGRYEVVQVHQSGGMGLVYRVRHLEWDTDLAVKCPRAEMFDTAARRELFIAEAETWVSLGLHPHVCACHYVRQLDGVPRVFAEYVAGGSLRDWIVDGRLYEGGPAAALARMLDVAVQFAWGLAHAHDRGFVHQDVKPGNVLLDVTGSGLVAKVTDFGLARAGAVAPAPTVTDAASGVTMAVTSNGYTPAYASPEQAAGRQVGRRTDVYSFGVSLLEMFTGGISWMPGAAGSVLAERRGRSEPEIPPLPPELADLLQRALSPDPHDRPASMAEAAAELAAIYGRVTGTPYPRTAPAAADLRADELNNRGLSLLDLGRRGEARETFAAALAADPHHLHAAYNAGLLGWRQGEQTDEDVVATLEAAAAGSADPGEARRLLAEVHRERGDHGKADALLGREPAAGAGPSSGTRRIPWYDYPAHVEFDGMEIPRQPPRMDFRFTQDGVYAVTACDGEVRVWSVPDGQCLRELEDDEKPDLANASGAHSTTVGISGEGQYAVTGGMHTVRFWDLAESRCLRVFDAAAPEEVRKVMGRGLHWPNSMCLSGDGRVAVGAYYGGVVLVWDFPSGALRLVLDGHDRASASVSHDGRLLLTAGREDGTARLWEVATGRCVRVLEGCDRAYDAWLSPYGDTAVVTKDGEIRVWELHKGRTRTLRGVGRLPRASVFGDFVVSMDVDDTVRLWSLDDGRCLRTFRGDGSRVLAVHLDLRAGVLLSAWQDSFLRWWTVPPRHTAPPRLGRPREHAELNMLGGRVAGLMERARQAADPVAALQLLTEARAVPGYEREPRLLSAWRELGRSAERVGLRSAWPSGVFEAGAQQVALDTDADGRVAVSGGVGGTVRVWNLETGACLRVNEKKPNLVPSVGISDDGSRAVYAYSGVVTAWSVESGERVTVLDNPLSLGVTAFDRAARSALIARPDGIRLWNLDTGGCEQELPPHGQDGDVTALWLGTGLAVSAGSDRTVRVWDLKSGQCLHTLRGHTHRVLSVCLSPDGRHVLSAGGYTDRTVRLWDTATGQCLRVFGDTEPESPRGVKSVPRVQSKRVRFTPDGRFAISGGSDTTVRLWEPATGRCLSVLEGHRGGVGAVATSPDARFALSAAEDATVRRWELDWDLRAPG
jgi:WD40 repeat protein